MSSQPSSPRPAAGASAGTRAVRDDLDAKGDLRPFEVVTCLVIWLTDARALRTISAHEIHAHCGPHDRPPAAAPVRSVSDALRRAYRARLLAEVDAELAHASAAANPWSARVLSGRAVGGASEGSPLTRGIVVPRRPDAGLRFVPTALGRLVVDALPDTRAVGTLRGLPGAAALYRTSARLRG